ncbi:YlzJ-like family protein [Paenibacillus xerothermodurans]|uniref:Uncharacterized protein n=1 Tax=Paenibacillus xerothermodurans TaxID=1977292 RepID=A0A2W1NS59_PAEXE|nr:YlzJ-like family protein [Paenibacillus xerothermodurans]PZE22395.1 hypothetical protein CBW46_001020 [Paenibacillus xerothermodurans]
MIHTVLPLDVVLDGMDQMAATSVEVVINGVTMEVQPINARQATIVRLLSCNPQDFLNPAHSPGTIIQFQPVI